MSGRSGTPHQSRHPKLLTNARNCRKAACYALIATAAAFAALSPAAAQKADRGNWQAVVDIAEVRLDGSGSFAWESAIYRALGDDQLHFELDGGGTRLSKIEGTQFQALYEHPVTAREVIWAGVEHDFTDGADLDLLVVGGSVQWNDAIYSEISAFVTPDGKRYHQSKIIVILPISASWGLESRAELNYSFQDEPARLRGAGPMDVNVGTRLRRTQEAGFAPYVGILWQRSLGRTARIVRDAGDEISSLSVVIGVAGTY